MLVCVLFNGLSGNEVTASCEEVMHNSWISDEDSSGEEEADQHWESARSFSVQLNCTLSPMEWTIYQSQFSHL